MPIQNILDKIDSHNKILFYERDLKEFIEI